MWKTRVRGLSKEYNFKAPATKADILLVKEELCVELPAKLKQLYSETNGIYSNYTTLIWSTEQLVKENLFFRTLHEYREDIKPLNNFLFFSDSGFGDLFGYSVVNGVIKDESIYVWDHEDDRRRVIASALEEFIEGWISGKISF